MLGTNKILTLLGLGALIVTVSVSMNACGDASGDGDGDATTTGDGDGDGDGDGEAGETGDSGEPAPSCMGSVGGPFEWEEGGIMLAAMPQGAQLAVAGDGTALAAWEEHAPPAMILSAYYNGSGDFGGATGFPSVPGTEQLRLAGTADGNFVALWLENGGWKGASSMGNGGWSDPANVGGGGENPALDASDFGDAVAVWHQGGKARGNLLTSGSGWGSATDLGAIFDGEAPLAAAMSRNGNWSVAAWSAGGGDVSAVVSEGGAWGDTVALSGEGNYVYDVEVGTDCSGASYVVWAQGDADEGFQDGVVRIYSARHNGSEWGGAEQIDGGNGIAFGGGAGQSKAEPSFGIGVNGDAVVAWVNRGASSVMATVRDGDAGSWGAPTMVGDTSSSGDRTVITGVDRDGNASVLYNYGNGRIQAARYDGSSWSAPTTVRMGGLEDFLALEYADDGTAVMLTEISTGLKPFYLR